MRYRGKRTKLSRFFLLIVTTSVGWMIIGVGIFIGSLIWGLNSQSVTYMQTSGSSNYDISAGTQSGNTYINLQGSDNYYVAFTRDFMVPQNDVSSTASFSLIARTNTSMLNPPLKASDGMTINDAYKIEKLVLYDQNGQALATFTTAEYNAHPTGYIINNWPYASVSMLAGALCAGMMLFFTINARKRKKLAAAAEQAALEGRPSIFARELAENTPPTNPYAHPYQQPQPVQQNSPYTQPDSYGQMYLGTEQYPQVPVYGQPPRQLPSQE